MNYLLLLFQFVFDMSATKEKERECFIELTQKDSTSSFISFDILKVLNINPYANTSYCGWIIVIDFSRHVTRRIHVFILFKFF